MKMQKWIYIEIGVNGNQPVYMGKVRGEVGETLKQFKTRFPKRSVWVTAEAEGFAVIQIR